MGKLGEIFTIVFGGGAVAILFILLMAISPALCLWSLNTLSEQAHWGWHIPHNTWTYLAVIGLFLLKGSDYSSDKK